MLDKVKLSLRITHSALDGDILEQIEACKKDLQREGVTSLNGDDFLILQAVKLYVKWHLNYENEGERYRDAYNNLAQSLSLCGDYNV